MKKIHFIVLLLVVAVGTAIITGNHSVLALDPIKGAESGVSAAGGGGAPGLGRFIQNIINILLYILGAISVIMIVIGGIRYTTSNGDASAVTGAKNTILYSIVGLVVAMLAYAIVNFVLTNIG